MKKILSVTPGSNTTDIALLIARIGIAALMLTHGIPKMTYLFSGVPIQFPPVMGLTPTLSLSLAVFAEVLCSIFLLIGFRTRLAAIPLIVTMLMAVFVIHGADPFAKQEPAFQYLLVYVILLVAGGGKYSLDNLLQEKTIKSGYRSTKFNDPTLSIYQ